MTPYDEGFEAYYRDAAGSANPWPEDTLEHEAWLQGFRAAEKEHEEDFADGN